MHCALPPDCSFIIHQEGNQILGFRKLKKALGIITKMEKMKLKINFFEEVVD